MREPPGTVGLRPGVFPCFGEGFNIEIGAFPDLCKGSGIGFVSGQLISLQATPASESSFGSAGFEGSVVIQPFVAGFPQGIRCPG